MEFDEIDLDKVEVHIVPTISGRCDLCIGHEMGDCIKLANAMADRVETNCCNSSKVYYTLKKELTTEDIFRGMLEGKKYKSSNWASVKYCYYSAKEDSQSPFRYLDATTGHRKEMTNFYNLVINPHTFSEYKEYEVPLEVTDVLSKEAIKLGISFEKYMEKYIKNYYKKGEKNV